MNGEQPNPWDLIRKRLKDILSPVSYDNWVARSRLSGIDGRTLIVAVPDEPTAGVLTDEYSPQVNAIARQIDMGLDQVVFVVEGSTSAYSHELHRESLPELESPIALNPRFTFDSFVVGACNQFAHAAARAVAANPSRRYNPLFLYGGVGMGKTHLMHAIGRALMARGQMRIIYTTSERFTNEVVSGIKYGKMPQLRERYRSADVLLIDDIQSLGSKDRTQEEFFHTFNELHDGQKQIVVSSDCQPKEIHGLVERLRSRFEWGLMADIEPPDLETRMAILAKKAEIEGAVLPADVQLFIAQQTKSNVRELEGALVKLVAYSSLTATPITLAMARQVLKHLVEKQDRRITIEAIQKVVAEKYAIKPSALREKSNRKEIVVPRQVAMFVAKELTQASLPEIGRAFGGKHHTTVIHSVNKIADQRATDPDLNKLINSVVDSFQ